MEKQSLLKFLSEGIDFKKQLVYLAKDAHKFGNTNDLSKLLISCGVIMDNNLFDYKITDGEKSLFIDLFLPEDVKPACSVLLEKIHTFYETDLGEYILLFLTHHEQVKDIDIEAIKRAETISQNVIDKLIVERPTYSIDNIEELVDWIRENTAKSLKGGHVAVHSYSIKKQCISKPSSTYGMLSIYE